MLKIYDAETARHTILRRSSLDEIKVPPRVLQGIRKTFGKELTPAQSTAQVLNDVRRNGDAALRRWTTTFDGVAPESFRVSDQDLQAALQKITPAQRQALEDAARRVETFHRQQPLTSWMTQDLGGMVGQLIRPIQRVGLYIPGGTAALPSSIIMSATLARVVGVPEIVVATPPAKDTGQPAVMTLAAAAVCRVDEVYAIGGAQAIGALAYGTESIRRVDKIYGPGNLFVTLAKQQVFGVVGIDNLAGPTETVVIADEYARPDWVAADLLAQAEHDVLASAILLTPSQSLAEAVQKETLRLMEGLSRKDIILASFENRGGIVLTSDLDEAVALNNAYAPEHLGLAVKDPWIWTQKVQAAGGIFVGEHSFEVLGDYAAGPSHVMPTGGSARFASPLNAWDFVRIISLVGLDPQTAKQIGPTAAEMAHAEGLDAHALAAELRSL